jgi:hypothetical protein
MGRRITVLRRTWNNNAMFVIFSALTFTSSPLRVHRQPPLLPYGARMPDIAEKTSPVVRRTIGGGKGRQGHFMRARKREQPIFLAAGQTPVSALRASNLMMLELIANRFFTR